jgi:aromatic ring-opening dioxygenase catalytic subunit (LigB family)
MSGEFRKGFATLEASLKELPHDVGVEPKAILVVSGHWEDKVFAVMSSPAPGMVYDFRGFGEDMYEIRYPARGFPEVARQIHSLIQDAGLPARLDPVRGFDHGTYSLLAVAYPKAEVPVVQISIRSDYDPEAHLKLGRALAPLRDDGILIIGSGMSYHNLRSFFHGNGASKEPSAQFNSWLKETLVDSPPAARSARLVEWERAPFARAAQPQEDHLVPLHAVVGAAEQEPAQIVYHEDNFLANEITVSSYKFGE